MMVQEIQKIHLRECKELEFHKGGIKMFRMNPGMPELSGKLRLTTPAIGGFETDYAKYTLKPKRFIILAHATGASGMEIEITEEMLQQMLDYVKAEKQKVYTMKELS